MKTLSVGSNGMTSVAPVRSGGVRDWPRWTSYAAVGWSLIYAALGIYWAISGRGFSYAAQPGSNMVGSVVGRFGPGIAWIAVLLAGLPAAAMGAAMTRGMRGRVLRPLFIICGALLAGTLLLLMADLTLLEMLGYIPYAVVGLLTGGRVGQIYLEALAQVKWVIAHQLFCILGGFLWLGATVFYTRRSGDACAACGRRDDPEGWTSPNQAARWGRIALVVALIAPIYYAITRFAWALGFPLGMTHEHLRQGQLAGLWIAGLFLACFGLVGAALMLGLIQRWGEAFPRWMIGLAGRRVPIALAVIPASIVSVVLIVGGLAIWSSLGQMMANAAAAGAVSSELTGSVVFEVGPTLLFPVWGAALAAATLAYYFRRRGPCKVCGRGGSAEIEKPL